MPVDRGHYTETSQAFAAFRGLLRQKHAEFTTPGEVGGTEAFLPPCQQAQTVVWADLLTPVMCPACRKAIARRLYHFYHSDNHYRTLVEYLFATSSAGPITLNYLSARVGHPTDKCPTL